MNQVYREISRWSFTAGDEYANIRVRMVELAALCPNDYTKESGGPNMWEFSTNAGHRYLIEAWSIALDDIPSIFANLTNAVGGKWQKTGERLGKEIVEMVLDRACGPNRERRSI